MTLNSLVDPNVSDDTAIHANSVCGINLFGSASRNIIQYIYYAFFLKLKNFTVKFNGTFYNDSSDSLNITIPADLSKYIASATTLEYKTTTLTVNGLTGDSLKSLKISYSTIYSTIVDIASRFAMFTKVIVTNGGKYGNWRKDATDNGTPLAAIRTKKLESINTILKQSWAPGTPTTLATFVCLLTSSVPKKSLDALVKEFDLREHDNSGDDADGYGTVKTPVNGTYYTRGATLIQKHYGAHEYGNCVKTYNDKRWSTDTCTASAFDLTASTKMRFSYGVKKKIGVIKWQDVKDTIDSLANLFDAYLRDDAKALKITRYKCYCACHANWGSSRSRR